MPHNISIDASSRAEMMYVGEMPWHALGTRLAEPPTAEKAILAAHLDWRVVKKQLYVGDERRPLPGQYAIVRADRWARSEDSIFGIVGKSYTPLQNAEAFEFFDAEFVDARLQELDGSEDVRPLEPPRAGFGDAREVCQPESLEHRDQVAAVDALEAIALIEVGGLFGHPDRS